MDGTEEISYIPPEHTSKLLRSATSACAVVCNLMEERAEMELNYARQLSAWAEKQRAIIEKQVDKVLHFPEVNSLLLGLAEDATCEARLRSHTYDFIAASGGPLQELRNLRPQCPRSSAAYTTGRQTSESTEWQVLENTLSEYQVVIERHLMMVDNVERSYRKYDKAQTKHTDTNKKFQKRRDRWSAMHTVDSRRMLRHLQTRMTSSEAEMQVAKSKYDGFLRKEQSEREVFRCDISRYMDDVLDCVRSHLEQLLQQLTRFISVLKIDWDREAGGPRLKHLNDLLGNLHDLDSKLVVGAWETKHSSTLRLPGSTSDTHVREAKKPDNLSSGGCVLESLSDDYYLEDDDDDNEGDDDDDDDDDDTESEDDSSSDNNGNDSVQDSPRPVKGNQITVGFQPAVSQLKPRAQLSQRLAKHSPQSENSNTSSSDDQDVEHDNPKDQDNKSSTENSKRKQWESFLRLENLSADFGNKRGQPSSEVFISTKHWRQQTRPSAARNAWTKEASMFNYDGNPSTTAYETTNVQPIHPKRVEGSARRNEESADRFSDDGESTPKLRSVKSAFTHLKKLARKRNFGSENSIFLQRRSHVSHSKERSGI